MDYRVYSIRELREAGLPLCLSSSEQLMAEKRGRDFAVIRSQLRRELSRRLGTSAADIELQTGPHGKPEHPDIYFNISHSGDCLCMAFHHGPVGVDTERIRPRDFARLAGHFMSAEQLSLFTARGCSCHEFFACWCTAEALVKMAGDTIWNARNYPFVYCCDGRMEVTGRDDVTVELFEPLPGYMGAVAFSPPAERLDLQN